jgi:hypothetical protein
VSRAGNNTQPGMAGFSVSDDFHVRSLSVKWKRRIKSTISYPK